MKRLLAIAVLVLAGIAGTATKSEAIAISFVPQNQTVTLGSFVNVDLVISGLGIGGDPYLGAFDLDVTISNPIVSYLGYSLGANLGALGTESDDFSLGHNGISSINLAQLSYLTPSQLVAMQGAQGGSFTLATLNFQANSLGTTFLNITFGVFSDEWGNQIFPTLGQGQINVVAPQVPEPSTLLLIGPVAVGMLVRRYRKNRTTRA